MEDYIAGANNGCQVTFQHIDIASKRTQARRYFDWDGLKTERLNVAKMIYSNIITSQTLVIHCLNGYIHRIRKSLNIQVNIFRVPAALVG